VKGEKKKILILQLFIILLVQILFSSGTFAKNGKPNTPAQEAKYQKKVLKQVAIEKYERSLLPESGYMTTEEYEKASRDITNSEKKIPVYKIPKDTNMKYIPQPIYKIVRYNNPPGTPELHIQQKFYSDRQVNGASVTSPNKDIMVYPVVYYYAYSGNVAGELFVIPLDKSLPDVERLSMANVVKRNPNPILSTEKNISERFIFRTMTPIDFSPDGSKLIAKEKIGGSNDGIWKTNLWVYDFNTKAARIIPEVRDAIKYYWYNENGLVLDEKRWDIYPLGFDANDPNRIVVSAYGFTGKKPDFLGNWSIDCQGERSMLVSLTDAETKISVNGLKLIQDGVVDPSKVYNNEKEENKIAKKNKAKAKKDKKLIVKKKKQALKEELKNIQKEESATIKNYNAQLRKSGPTGID